MSERLPPAIAIFLSEAVRRRVMPRLGARVASLRYDPAHTIKPAFVEELAQAMAVAAQRLNPDIAPALSVVVIADLVQPALETDLIGLLRQACPPHVSLALQWVSLYAPHVRPAQGVAFLLSTTWRGGLLQGGALDRAYLALVLSLLATETSRVATAGFDCFSRLRFHSPGKVYKVAIDPIDLPDFAQLAQSQLRAAAVASYFPEIDARAQAAAARAPAGEDPLCNALAQCATVTEAAALLSEWPDLQVALIHWASSQTPAPADKQAAAPLFAAHSFPLLHELKPHVKTQQAFQQQAAVLQAELIKQKRLALDESFYQLLPGDLNASQRLAIASNLSHTNGRATRLTVTRHFPAALIQDTREEILDLRDISTVLYSLELEPE